MKVSELLSAQSAPTTIISVSPIAFRKSSATNHARYITDESGDVILDEHGRAKVRHFCFYEIPAAPAGGYSKLVVEPAFQMTRDVTNPEGESYVPRPIEGGSRLIAEDLVNYFSRHGLGADQGTYPGVMVIAGSEPTEAELAQCRAQHESWCRWLVIDGDARHDRPSQRGNITDLHRAAAAYLKIENLQQHPWIRITRSGDTKNCLACQEQISANATKCPKCQERLVPYAVEMGYSAEMLQKMDPLVAELVAQQQPSAKPQAASKKKDLVEVE